MAKRKSSKVTEVKTAQPRKIEAIQAEYTQICQLAGDLQYRIKIMENDLAQANQRLFNLNHEAAASKARQALEDASKAQSSQQVNQTSPELTRANQGSPGAMN